MKEIFEQPEVKSRFTLTDFSCATTNAEINQSELYRILWVKKGPASVLIDGVAHDLLDNQIVFLTPLNKLEIQSLSSNVIAFSFNRSFYCIKDHDREVGCYGHLFFGSSGVPIITLNKEEEQSFQRLEEVIWEEIRERDHIQGEMLTMLLKRLIIKSTRLAKKELPNPDIPNDTLDIIRQFNVLVEMNFKDHHQVQGYADLLHKSPKTLANIFTQYSEKTPLQTINDRIVLEAKRQLLYTDKTAKEIAHALGYDDAAHFSKFFKKQVGTSPLGFRKKGE